MKRNVNLTTPETWNERTCKFISLQTVHEICKSLVRHNGDINETFEDVKHLTNVTHSKIRDIKAKRSYPSISGMYFLVNKGKFVPIINETPEAMSIKNAIDMAHCKMADMSVNDLQKLLSDEEKEVIDEIIKNKIKSMSLTDLIDFINK